MRFDKIAILIGNRDEWDGTNLPLIGLHIYIDGSKMAEGTGTGVFSEELGTEK